MRQYELLHQKDVEGMQILLKTKKQLPVDTLHKLGWWYVTS